MNRIPALFALCLTAAASLVAPDAQACMKAQHPALTSLPPAQVQKAEPATVVEMDAVVITARPSARKMVRLAELRPGTMRMARPAPMTQVQPVLRATTTW